MSNYLDLGYSNLLTKITTVDLSSGINSANSEAIIGSGVVGYGQTSLFKLNPGEDIQSGNFSPGVIGWQIKGDGTAEFVGITLSGGTLKYSKTSFTDSVHAGYIFDSNGMYVGAANDVSSLKYNIGTGVFDFIGTASSRSTLTLANAINASGQLITDIVNARLDSSAKTILASFTFGASGAIQIGTYSAGISGDVKISPNGIVGRNSANATTFALDATTGEITAIKLVGASGSIGSFTIGTYLYTGSKTAYNDANAGIHIGSDGIGIGNNVFTVSSAGAVVATSISITGGVLDGTSTIGGRLASILNTAIDASGHFADAAISTATQSILGAFTFGASGALQIGTYSLGVSGDLKLSPNGILARDSTGATTFSINGTTGVAVLNGLVVGTNVGLGTAQDSAGVTTIIGNVVTTGFVNALNVNAATVSASISITTPTITGGTFQTDAGVTTGIKMDSTSLRGYDGVNNITFSLVRATGALTATSATITGALTTGAGSSINGTYIDSLNVNKLLAGSITSKAITLAIAAGTGDSYIAAGKTDFNNTVPGFILGLDDSDLDKAKFFIGNDTDYFNFNGSNVIFRTTLADAITIDYGSNILLKEGGNIKFTSVTAPTACTATLVATGIGNVDNGTHTYKVTYINAAGETELGTASNTVTVDASNKQVNLSNIPISSSGGVTGRKVYRTKAGGIYYYLLATLNVGDTTYTDNTADASLTGGISNDKDNDSFGKIYVDNVKSLVLGSRNTLVGQYCGYSLTSGDYNTAVGVDALYYNKSGQSNIAVGYESLHNNDNGGSNVSIGDWSMYHNMSGAGNVAIGTYSLYTNNLGLYNTAIGAYSLAFNDQGERNTAIGRQALYSNTTGNYNTAIGEESLYITNTGNNNTGIGAYALNTNNFGNNNVAIGYCAGAYETSSNSFYVDNQNRTNTAGDKAGAILYGVFNANPASQTLKINAVLTTQGNIELGHATDTTISRISAGVVAIEGNNILTANTGLPLAGGTMTGKIVSSGSSEVGKTYTPAAGAQTVALDCALNNVHVVSGNAAGTAITFTIANATNSQPFIVSILQGGTTVSTIAAWFATIRWAGGTAPTLTAILNKRDTFGFIRTGANTYDGFIIGQAC